MLKKLWSVIATALVVSMLAGCGNNATQEIAKQVSESGKAANEAAASVAEGFSNIGEKANEFQDGVDNASVPLTSEESSIEQSGLSDEDFLEVLCNMKAADIMDEICGYKAAAQQSSADFFYYFQRDRKSDKDEVSYKYELSNTGIFVYLKLQKDTQKISYLDFSTYDTETFATLSARAIWLSDFELDSSRMDVYVHKLMSGDGFNTNGYDFHAVTPDNSGGQYFFTVKQDKAVQESSTMEPISAVESSSSNNVSDGESTSLLLCSEKAKETMDAISGLENSSFLVFNYEQTDMTIKDDVIDYSYGISENDFVVFLEIEKNTQKLVTLSFRGSDQSAFFMLCSRALLLHDFDLSKSQVDSYSKELMSGQLVCFNDYVMGVDFNTTSYDYSVYSFVATKY